MAGCSVMKVGSVQLGSMKRAQSASRRRAVVGLEGMVRWRLVKRARRSGAAVSSKTGGRRKSGATVRI